MLPDLHFLGPRCPTGISGAVFYKSSLHGNCIERTLMGSPCRQSFGTKYLSLITNVQNIMDGKTPPVQKRRGVGVIFLILAPQDVSVPRSVLNLRRYSTKIVTQQRRVSRIYPMLHVIISFMLSRRGSGRRVERMKGECRQKQTKNNDGKGVPLRLNDGDTKEKKNWHKYAREERDK